jgi:hypothetical protein
MQMFEAVMQSCAGAAPPGAARSTCATSRPAGTTASSRPASTRGTSPPAR